MYCHFCGRPSDCTCAACGHKACPDHRRKWLFLTVCRGCYKQVWTGVATSVALVAGAAFAYYYFMLRS